MTCVAAWCSLVEFPFASPIYFAYAAPLVIVTVMALADVTARPAPILRLATLGGYCVLALIMRPRVYPRPAMEPGPFTKMTLPRGGIAVSAVDAARYQDVVSLLSEHSRGRFTLATPDLPQIYFLSGLENPTHTFFEAYDYPPTSPLDILPKIDRYGITAIVINHEPVFSSALPAAVEDSLAHRFPEAQSVGPLEVRWRQ
jgi:hypothetical protein